MHIGFSRCSRLFGTWICLQVECQGHDHRTNPHRGTPDGNGACTTGDDSTIAPPHQSNIFSNTQRFPCAIERIKESPITPLPVDDELHVREKAGGRCDRMVCRHQPIAQKGIPACGYQTADYLERRRCSSPSSRGRDAAQCATKEAKGLLILQDSVTRERVDPESTATPAENKH